MGSICPKGKIKIIPKSVSLMYSFGKFLGQGYFGVVHEACRKNNSEVKVAIKTIKKDKKPDNHEELDNLKKLDHPYIVKLLEAFEDDEALHLVMECCSDGDLFEKVNSNKRLTESQSKALIKKILLAVNYLHMNSIVHRDLKPENFLFQGSEIKMIDFGYSTKFTKHFNIDNTETFLHTLVGTAQYLAPEVLRGKYDQKCDLWSVGVILYFMLSGTLPFTGSNNKECFKKILKGEFTFTEQPWADVSGRCRKFICQLLKTNPKKRLSAKQALKHKWLSEDMAVNISYSFIFSIKNIYYQCEFKKYVGLVLVKYLCTEEIKEITSTFLSINESNSGVICVSELEKALKKLDPNQETKDIYKLFTEEGKITYSNFVAAAIFTRPVSESILFRGFKLLSSKKSNVITASSLYKALKFIGKPVSKPKVRRMISEIDPQEQSRINYKEFKIIFLSSYRSKSY
jgi:calcium-dependent protein kinase